MKFSVRRYEGADNPQNGYETVEAGSAQEAAEKVCGEPLIAEGKPARLRATVHKQPPESAPKAFYSKA